MSMQTTGESFYLPSKDGVSRIHAMIWMPPEKPRGIVQLVHGMSEHILRYERFAQFLNAHGFVVCGSDHIGHGKTVPSSEYLGHMPAANGKDILLEDIHAVRLAVQQRCGEDLPYIIFGHSMGSFVVRSYLTCHVEGVHGAIICGTGHPALALSRFGKALAGGIARVKGDRSYSKLIHGMADGAYSNAVKDARTPADWLSTDPVVVDTYIADELCGQQFTVGGYVTLMSLTETAADPKLAARIPKDLPLLFVSGSEDPVGSNGRDVKTAAKMYLDAGIARVDIKLYEGMRHEILNEPDYGIVHRDIMTWLEGVL